MPELVPDDEPLEEGETYQNVYLIEPHSFIPFPDLAAKLTAGAVGLEQEMNSHTELSGVRTTILSKDLVQQDDRKFHYIVTYRIDYVPDHDARILAASYGKIMGGLIATTILAIAVSWTLIEVRKTAKETPLALLGLGLLLWKGLESRSGSSS